jgi:2-desacetyl-2-hydroxyethyl bacteriochlorophyllide A dehydrogenase
MKIEDVPMPKVGPRDVLVEVAACGMCHTDINYLKKGLRPPKVPPLILGHEPSGIVSEVGEQVVDVKKGDRVLICYTIPCGECFLCRSGRENICATGNVIGASRDGAFAEFISVPEKVVTKLPPEIPLEEGAIITDAVAASYHAVVNIAKVKPGDKVVVYGASGGLGLNVVQIASAFGADVIGVGRKKWKLEKAKEFGASVVISSLEVERPDKKVQQLTNGGADIAIEVTGDPKAMELACRSTRSGGRIVIVGYSTENFQAPSLRVMWFELSIMGSSRYRPIDLSRVVEMVQRGLIKIDGLVSHKFPLEEINKGYEMLDKGEVLRALVIP